MAPKPDLAYVIKIFNRFQLFGTSECGTRVKILHQQTVNLFCCINPINLDLSFKVTLLSALPSEQRVIILQNQSPKKTVNFSILFSPSKSCKKEAFLHSLGNQKMYKLQR